ncbi:HNH endonuclease family protein [Corynebacterium uterequi]|uniref:Putative DUF1524 family protein n=1 Tax=Corynebacterium uterequi TaxID=1072256 RepID=A0A0G3HDR6_9CORY|nr:HNH endonuclease family protein [Corynebacterium uterequi]AKK10855.1 putative DUF1524 family protein [Corynebacterium uterequi]
MRRRLFRIYVGLLAAATLAYSLSWGLPWLFPRVSPNLPRVSYSLADTARLASRPNQPGYDRDAFGGWARVGPCSTRELAMTAVYHHDGCRSFGQAVDPYTGRLMLADDTEIDHIVPLAAAWDLGAWQWDAQTRRRFANDPLNLVVTSAEANQDKSDQLPASWLPSARRNRCWYARRVGAVVDAYQLALPSSDARAMLRQCPDDWWRVGGWRRGSRASTPLSSEFFDRVFTRKTTDV